MDFREHLFTSEQAALALVRNPGDLWREGFGLAKPHQELAAVIHYAGRGYPPEGKSLLIHKPDVEKGDLYEKSPL
jgi:hypothetical protein